MVACGTTDSSGSSRSVDAKTFKVLSLIRRRTNIYADNSKHNIQNNNDSVVFKETFNFVHHVSFYKAKCEKHYANLIESFLQVPEFSFLSHIFHFPPWKEALFTQRRVFRCTTYSNSFPSYTNFITAFSQIRYYFPQNSKTRNPSSRSMDCDPG